MQLICALNMTVCVCVSLWLCMIEGIMHFADPSHHRGIKHGHVYQPSAKSWSLAHMQACTLTHTHPHTHTHMHRSEDKSPSFSITNQALCPHFPAVKNQTRQTDFTVSNIQKVLLYDSLSYLWIVYLHNIRLSPSMPLIFKLSAFPSLGRAHLLRSPFKRTASVVPAWWTAGYFIHTIYPCDAVVLLNICWSAALWRDQEKRACRGGEAVVAVCVWMSFNAEIHQLDCTVPQGFNWRT